jgi:hypothetical protein
LSYWSRSLGFGFRSIFNEKFSIGLQLRRIKSQKMLESATRPAVNNEFSHTVQFNFGFVLAD